MRKSILAMVLAAVLCFSGCSGNSSSGGETSITQHVNREELKVGFEKKCDTLVNSFMTSSQSTDFDVKLTVPRVNYEDDAYSLSKIYVVSATGNDEDERALISFLDIYCEDEYQYFQTLKRYIEFISENAIDISGREQYIISVNATESGIVDIGITCSSYGASIVYGDRSIKSAYSSRLKNMELFKDSSESIAIRGLIKFEDLPSDVVSYDITVMYNDKAITHKWYSLDNDGDKVFVTYIDDGTYDNLTDDELLYYAYSAVHDKQNELESLNEFCFAHKSGELVGNISYFNHSFGNVAYAHWSGQYEHLNSDPLNQSLLSELNGEKAE
ncbi:MAG: hypothetical protein E7485_08480 [Ruminococcaceae bacterium]|nr:hypothetical protein [Oscillospiraceae bacterium]